MSKGVPQKLLEAVDLAQQGANATDLVTAGFSQSTAYRAIRIAKSGMVLSPSPKIPHEPPHKVTIVDTETGEIVDKSVADGGHHLPITDDKFRLRSQTLPGGQMVMVQDVFDPSAQSLSMVTKTIRIPMPAKLPTLMAICKTEWGMGDVPVDRLLDAIIECFLRDRGFLVGPWTKLVEAEKYIKEVKGDGSGAKIPAASGVTATATQQADDGVGGVVGQAEEAGGGESGGSRVAKDGDRVGEGA